MPASTLTNKGQTTAPRKVRDHLKLQPGDRIDFVIEQNGSVSIRPATIPIQELKGMLHRKNMKAVPVEGMNAAIRKRFRRNQ
jgi:AbrB family looped-hinge helix DNA binding protein